MTMKVLTLQLHCEAHDALIIIELLDQIRDTIADTYSDEIRETIQIDLNANSDQRELPFDDPIPF